MRQTPPFEFSLLVKTTSEESVEEEDVLDVEIERDTRDRR